MIIIIYVIVNFITISSAQNDDLIKFNKFKQEYNRKYPTKSEEKLRFEVFKKNLEYIEKMNLERKDEYSATFSINEWADRFENELPKHNLDLFPIDSAEEDDDNYNYNNPNSNSSKPKFINGRFSKLNLTIEGQLPINLSYCSDLTKYNSIDDKNDYCGNYFGNDQGGSCGSCYGAATANYAQYLYARDNAKNGNIPIYKFGFQLYLNDTKSGNNRCCGGNYRNIYKSTPFFYLYNEGPYLDYYTSQNKEGCSPSGIMLNVHHKYEVNEYHTFGYSKSLSHKEYLDIIKRILYKYGPFTTTIRVGNKFFDWGFYTNGLLNLDGETCKVSHENGILPDHAILVVGYGRIDNRNNDEYILIRNSWGNGPKYHPNYGYIKINATSNIPALCGIAWDRDGFSLYYPNNVLVNKRSRFGDEDSSCSVLIILALIITLII